MKFILLTCLSLIAFAHASHISRIVGGQQAPEGKYPYQALTKNLGIIVCGASILNRRWLLTAGHCAAPYFPYYTTVTVGTTDRETNGTGTYQVDHFVVHPDYWDPNPMEGPDNDIALIYLSEDIQFNEKVKPVRLPENDLSTYENAAANLTGWGRLETFGDVPRYLQELEVKVVERKKCNEIWKKKGVNITDNLICTLTKRGQGACKHDSGGPLVSNGVQIGVVSFGDPCARGMPDVYARVTSYLDWIKETIKLDD